MHVNTPLQLLPDHIVKLIVDYVVNKGPRDDGVDYIPHDRPLLMPLLWVCHNFRAHVYALFCRHCELDLAKKLTIVVDLRSIYSGNALQKLSIDPYEGCNFPLVGKLSLDLYVDGHDSDDYSTDSEDNGEASQQYPPETVANIAAFVLRLKEMAPVINTLASLSIDSEDLVAAYVDLGHICNLAHIQCLVEDNDMAILSLARRNAQTLQTLHIEVYYVRDFSDLVRDPDGGRYVEYSRLRKLTLITSEEFAEPQGLGFAGAVPFPSLRRLCVSYNYPFNDDVLFRGNSSTLEYLDLALTRAMIS
ncbi:hypothetical protein GGI21_005051, partial [Coemansia aciculifera]